jgi:hypothetical protein
MPTVLSDPSPNLYAVLVIIVLVLAGIAYRRQKRGDVIRFIVAVAALVALFLIDHFVESPREQASRKVLAMAQASQEKKWDDVVTHVSDSFKYHGPNGHEFDKEGFRQLGKRAESIPEFKGFVVTDLHRADYRILDEKNFKISFTAFPREVPNPEYRFWIVATFTMDPDGEWRMSTFNRYDPVKQDHRGPALTIPGVD